MLDNTNIVRAAMAVRAETVTDSWAQFVLAMREYAAASAVDMVGCPVELLPRAQGMAVMAHELATTLNNAPQLYEKMQAAAAMRTMRNG
jgi:hypothetical protein